MKKFIFIAASSLFNITAVQAADGTITINGLVTDNTCTIDTGDKNLTVNLPTVSSQSLKNAGDVAGRTPFQINLTNCASVGKVATYFEPGATVDFNTGRLLNQATSGAAANVNIQLLGSNNAVIPVIAKGASGAQDNSQWVNVSAGGNADLNYYAEYYATGASTAGTVTSQVKYTIIYQ
ncbi:type 1 fimbrial protein [Acinetobacter baumannii]|nr:type 1 fimbrial protein [Acinetobacter baumannii]